VKEFLSRAGRGFDERNVDTDLDAYDELLGLGWRTVPVTFIGGVAIAGFDEAALRAAIDDGVRE
jgi:glutaredoxin